MLMTERFLPHTTCTLGGNELVRRRAPANCPTSKSDAAIQVPTLEHCTFFMYLAFSGIYAACSERARLYSTFYVLRLGLQVEIIVDLTHWNIVNSLAHHSTLFYRCLIVDVNVHLEQGGAEFNFLTCLEAQEQRQR